MKKNNTDTFTSAFRKFLQVEKIDTKYREKLLIESWEAIMGKPIASRTSSLYIKDKTLFATFTSAPLKQEMVNNKARVMELISKDFGDLINDVRFQ